MAMKEYQVGDRTFQYDEDDRMKPKGAKLIERKAAKTPANKAAKTPENKAPETQAETETETSETDDNGKGTE